jgi:hypothetical protein
MSIPKHIMASKKACGETNDCTVIACAIATGKAYDDVHKIFTRCGRKRKKGCTTWTVEKVLSVLGFKVEKLEKWKGKTCASLELPRKDNYIAFTCDHALAIKFGLLKDWSDGRRNRITEVWKILPR